MNLVLNAPNSNVVVNNAPQEAMQEYGGQLEKASDAIKIKISNREEGRAKCPDTLPPMMMAGMPMPMKLLHEIGGLKDEVKGLEKKIDERGDKKDDDILSELKGLRKDVRGLGEKLDERDDKKSGPLSDLKDVKKDLKELGEKIEDGDDISDIKDDLKDIKDDLKDIKKDILKQFGKSMPAMALSGMPASPMMMVMAKVIKEIEGLEKNLDKLEDKLDDESPKSGKSGKTVTIEGLPEGAKVQISGLQQGSKVGISM